MCSIGIKTNRWHTVLSEMGNDGGLILSMAKIIVMELESTDETGKMADIKSNIVS